MVCHTPLEEGTIEGRVAVFFSSVDYHVIMFLRADAADRLEMRCAFDSNGYTRRTSARAAGRACSTAGSCGARKDRQQQLAYWLFRLARPDHAPYRERV